MPDILRKRNSSFARSKKNQKVESVEKYIPTVYNTVNKVWVNKYFVYTVIGYHLYCMKYDPFNGGKMLVINHIPIEWNQWEIVAILIDKYF